MSGIKGRSGVYKRTQKHKEILNKSNLSTRFKKGQHPSPKTEYKGGHRLTKKIRQKMRIARKKYMKSHPKSAFRKGQVFTKSHLRNIRLSCKRGSNHPCWKGGISSLRQQIYNHFKYRQWRSDIFIRDNYTCQWCGRRSKKGNRIEIEAHHIKSFFVILEEYQIKTLEQALDCEELWNINNGLTLCEKCHNLTRGHPKFLKRDWRQR